MSEQFIFIYGPPASGKSSVSQMLARNLELPFYDLDTWIENEAAMSIPEIFAREGEDSFRLRETNALQAVTSQPAGVCALGGGALLRPGNRKLAETVGQVVCLSASFETILNRLGVDPTGRPLLDGDAKSQLFQLLNNRAEHYDSFPIRIPSDRLAVGEVVWQAQIRLGLFRVEGMGQPYDVRVLPGGINKLLGEMLRLRELQGPLALVSDHNVAALYQTPVLAALHQAGYQVHSIVIPAGEQHKTLAVVQTLLDGFLQAGLERGSTVIALGGGVVGDLAGFAAAIFLRGIRWITVPTSLLAMVDASLGGKTGADLPQGKNLVGAFHPPALVLADPDLLVSLPEVELRNGLAEVVKHGLLGDPQLFEICTCQNGRSRLALAAELPAIVSRAVAVKARLIQRDPFERGERAVLNLGHTLGHGIELASDFRYRHGEAVSIGMVAAARLSEQMGIATSGLAQTIERCLAGLGLPVGFPPDLDRTLLFQAIARDKKRKSGRLRLVLPEQIGLVRWGVEIDDPARLIDVFE